MELNSNFLMFPLFKGAGGIGFEMITLIPMNLILYSKPGCHLCEGLEEKLRSITTIDLVLDVRDITQDEAAFQAYQYEIPVLYVQTTAGQLLPTPRQSPRASVSQIVKMLQTFTLQTNDPAI